MPPDDEKRTIQRELVDRVVRGPGQAPAEMRTAAFDNAGLPDALSPLLGKAATRSAQVTDADFAEARAGGFSDDQLFELVVCAAIGASSRQYDAGLAALDEAMADAPGAG